MVLYAAVSLDGLIATQGGKTDWVKDDILFEQTVKNFGCVVMGSTTFQEYGKPPFKDVQHIVLSSKPAISKAKNVHFVSSVKQAIIKAKTLGFQKLLVIGGAQINASFAQAGVLTGLMVDIHSIKLKTGKKLFGDFTDQLNIKLLNTKIYPEGFTHMEYTVGKNT